MAGDISRQNGKKGGRPKGRKNAVTLEKEEALARFQERVRKLIDPIFNAQYALAQGCSFLYRIEHVGKGKGLFGISRGRDSLQKQ